MNLMLVLYIMGGLTLLFAVVVFFLALPDILRYIRLTRM